MQEKDNVRTMTGELQKLASVIHANELEAFSALVDYTISYMSVSSQAKADGWKYGKECNAAFYAAMAALFGEWHRGIQRYGWYDALGSTFMEYCKGFVSGKGQFFTPAAVADMMAECALAGRSKGWRMTRYGRRLTVSDPACGSGRCLLAAHARLCSKDRDVRPYLVAEDVDPLCVKMTALNFAAHGCLGEVVCHDTLAEPKAVRFGYYVGPVPELAEMDWVSIITRSDNPADFFITR